MRYKKTVNGVFLSRPNRFIARVLIEGEETICHVKNTGRCQELFLPGVCVVLARSENPARKTQYDVVAVYKGDKLINIDSQAPNQVFREWAEAGHFLPALKQLRPEAVYGQSRLDFLLSAGGKKIFVEIKGVTLEENGVARFPDAPTQRGTKHLRELTAALAQGYVCYAFFVIQMNGVHRFMPNDATDPEFGAALRYAESQGVHVLAYDCYIAEATLEMGEPVPILL